jgi:hypothetical protein
MDIGKAFTFVFEDDRWITKILLGAVILLVGVLFSWVLLIPLILAFAMLGGYTVEIMRRVMRSDLNVLPEWDDWGKLMADGLKVIVIGIVYALPLIIISICLGIPIGIFAEDAEALSTVFSLLLSCLSLLWAIVMSIALPAAIAFYIAHDELSAAFRFGEVLSFVRDNLSTYLITFLMSWVANFVGQLGSVVCGVGWLATVPYAYMVTGHLYGQAYLEAVKPAPEAIVEEEVA